MYDGINGQSILYVGIIFFSLIASIDINYLFLSILIVSVFFIKKNFEGRLFMGNNGTILIGSLISIVLIDFYNLKKILYADSILILMILPGLDMIRLFYIRIIKKTNRFRK